ncbi:hypothetical protein [Mangrovimonas sp. YM274]|uniref:hypothetical protein n=1 Tax=Mangrovimonas sp. YM274 TaxID=3070660 RepID=UPI0027DC4357|nr:hypothetical protein [Mangrovimonas sp. YM274]WMI69484.1 hypothetical protein RBH95_03740 [Mangrovimonas sp. YM274]
MKTLFLLAGAFLLMQSLDLAEVRSAYKEAAHDSSKVEVFYKSLSAVTKDDNISLVAYKGAAIALKAKQAPTIKEKKAGFMEGVSLIEFAIAKEPNAIEPRFVRLGIQENTPKLLKYKEDIEEDKSMLLSEFKNINSSNLKGHIKDYILQSKVFTTEEKTVISKL